MEKKIEVRVSNKIYYLYLLMSVMILGLHSVYMDLFYTNSLVLAVNQLFGIFLEYGGTYLLFCVGAFIL
jgi:hypothetical protein